MTTWKIQGERYIEHIMKVHDLDNDNCIDFIEFLKIFAEPLTSDTISQFS